MRHLPEGIRKEQKRHLFRHDLGNFLLVPCGQTRVGQTTGAEIDLSEYEFPEFLLILWLTLIDQ